MSFYEFIICIIRYSFLLIQSIHLIVSFVSLGSGGGATGFGSNIACFSLLNSILAGDIFISHFYISIPWNQRIKTLRLSIYLTSTWWYMTVHNEKKFLKLNWIKFTIRKNRCWKNGYNKLWTQRKVLWIH